MAWPSRDWCGAAADLVDNYDTLRRWDDDGRGKPPNLVVRVLCDPEECDRSASTAAGPTMRAEDLLFELRPQPWMAQANCTGIDPELFFPERGESAVIAKVRRAGLPGAGRVPDLRRVDQRTTRRLGRHLRTPAHSHPPAMDRKPAATRRPAPQADPEPATACSGRDPTAPSRDPAFTRSDTPSRRSDSDHGDDLIDMKGREF